MSDSRAKCDGCEHQLWAGQHPTACNLSGLSFPCGIQRQNGVVLSLHVYPYWEYWCPKLRPEKIRKEGLLYIKSHSEPITREVQEAVQKFTLLDKVYSLTDSEITYYDRAVVEYPPVRLITSNWESWHG